MTTTVQAIYSHGHLRLSRPVDIADGTQVDVIVITPEEAEASATNAADVLERIASLPPEPGSEGFSGRDHDGVLYPERSDR